MWASPRAPTWSPPLTRVPRDTLHATVVETSPFPKPLFRGQHSVRPGACLREELSLHFLWCGRPACRHFFPHRTCTNYSPFPPRGLPHQQVVIACAVPVHMCCATWARPILIATPACAQKSGARKCCPLFAGCVGSVLFLANRKLLCRTHGCEQLGFHHCQRCTGGNLVCAENSAGSNPWRSQRSNPPFPFLISEAGELPKPTLRRKFRHLEIQAFGFPLFLFCAGDAETNFEEKITPP